MTVARSITPVHPTAWQVRRARAVTRWYLDVHYRRPEDLGTPSMFVDREAVGHFAVTRRAFERGESSALFRVLVACAMFQRRQDAQILRILRGLSREQVRELCSLDGLTGLTAVAGCDAGASTTQLREVCDLRKESGEGACDYNPAARCQLKRHTVWLKRYGHFGKVPTSIALSIHEAGARDLADLRSQSIRSATSPKDAAEQLEHALVRAWRVNSKIAAMFLSALSAPDLSDLRPPWQEGVDWRRFVVIDSNVDLFLRAIRFSGPWTYDARRRFLVALAERVPLEEYRPGLVPNNPRLVQQAIYRFMSTSNRRLSSSDCATRRPKACDACPGELRGICAFS